MPSSGSRLTSGQQISARSQYGPDDRHDLLVDEPPDRDEVRPLLVGELLADGEEVRPEGFPEVLARDLRHCWLPSCLREVGIQERLHGGGQSGGVGGQLEVAAAVDVQLAPRISRCMIRALTSGMIGSSSPARISVGGRSRGSHGRLVQPSLGEQLVVVAAGRAEPRRGVQQVTGHGRVLPRAAAVQLAGHAGRVARVPVTPRREHAQQDARARRDHEHARRGRDQHQAAHPPGAGRRTAARARRPRRCRARRPAVAKLVEQAGQQRRQRGQVVGHDRGRRAADARHVEPDDRPPRVERVDERLEQLQAARRSRCTAAAAASPGPPRAPRRAGCGRPA